jgi:hypothetical protein
MIHLTKITHIMAKELLDRDQIDPALVVMGRARPAQRMRAEPVRGRAAF